MGSELRFVVTNTETKKSSPWLPIGESFESYRIASFEPRQEVLTLRKEGMKFELPLKQSHVEIGPLSLALRRRLTELAERGIAPADVVVRMDEKLQIILVLGAAEPPTMKRFVSVSLSKTEWHGAGWHRVFDEVASSSLALTDLPRSLLGHVSEADIEHINDRLKQVMPKWLPARPNKTLEPTPMAVTPPATQEPRRP